MIGRWLSQRGGGDDVVITTRVGAMPQDPAAALATAEGLSAAAIEAAGRGSLRRLGADAIGLYDAISMIDACH